MQVRRDIAEMRALMLKEQKPDGVWDLKRQRGGQVEIEFIAQWLELSDPLMLNPNTAAVIEATGRAELLNAHDTSLLLNALGLYQRLTHVLRLCIDGHFDPKTAPAPLLKALNQAAAQPDISTTEAYIAEVQEQVAGLFTQLIGRPEPEAK